MVPETDDRWRIEMFIERNFPKIAICFGGVTIAIAAGIFLVAAYTFFAHVAGL